ncbi:MAG: hypothetical protein Q7J27_03410 [Syntrophales bacterium]|nr:hypothetical protein [Syntrophales bacterium]
MVNDGNRIVINTGLPGFLLIDRITEAGERHIIGAKNFVTAPVYSVVESLAQLGAYHVRFLTRFERHAFLLKITHCKISAGEVIDGQYLLYGTLTNRSDVAFTYRLQAKKGDETNIEGEFLYATVDYNRNFKRKRLQNHYREVFSCLQNDIRTD